MRLHRSSRGLHRRDFVRLSAAAALGVPCANRARADEPVAITSVGARIEALAANAPLAMSFRGSTASECRLWQAEFAAKLRSLLGPHRPPESWQCTLERTVDCDDHIREERVLNAEGVAPLPLHLLLPKRGQGSEALTNRSAGVRRPAVLAIHGHGTLGYDAVVGRAETAEARAEIAEYHYDYGRELVRRGYVVAAPCLTPFGRRQAGSSRVGRKDDVCAQTFLGLQTLGRLLIGENLRDILWTLAYVTGLETVDRDRVGCVGLSYGGRMTMLAAALEPSIRVAVVSGALNCFQERVATGHSGGCQVIPSLLAFGDVPEIASLIAPRPCLWELGTRDSLISPEWAEIALERIQRAYRAFSALSQLRVDRFDGAHEWHGALAYPLLDAVLKP
jgi:dienelactone hydrolase